MAPAIDRVLAQLAALESPNLATRRLIRKVWEPILEEHARDVQRALDAVRCEADPQEFAVDMSNAINDFGSHCARVEKHARRKARRHLRLVDVSAH